MDLKALIESTDTANVSQEPHPTETEARPRGLFAARIRWPQLLMRGESIVASLGITLALIVIGAVVACGWWLFHTQRHSMDQARIQHLERVSEILANSIEVMLAEGHVTVARRMLIEAGQRYNLNNCRLVLPKGAVIAAANPASITGEPDSADWSGQIEDTPRTLVHEGTLVLHRPVVVSGRGQARLEVIAPLRTDQAMAWEAQTGVGAVGVTSLLALLLVYRWTRARLRAMGVVREALLAMQRGETAGSALTVAGHLGEEATAWNRILEEHQQFRREAAVEKVRQAQGNAPGVHVDLTAGCDAVSHGLLMIDEQMRIRYANNAAAVYLQTRREGLLDADAAEAIGDESIVRVVRDAVAGGLRRRATGELQHGENGHLAILRFAIHPIRRGEAIVAMVVIDDVTQQRVAEKNRHEFVAQATHELRTPLTNIRLYLETLQEDDDDPETRSQALNVLNHETHRLERLVGDMLSVAEIEAGSFEINRDDVKFDALLNDVQRDYDAQARDKRITLSFQIPPKLPIVRGDRDKLMLTVQNLVGNAIKYTPEGGQVTVAGDVRGDELTIEVRDTGIGIAPEELEKVFEKFFRARDRRVTSTTGTGLGLALAREIARLHGGDITVTSQVDQGSAFTLVLPVLVDSETATEQ